MQVTDRPVLVDVGTTPGNTKVINDGPSTVYFKDSETVTSANSDGSLGVGEELAFSAPTWFVTAPPTVGVRSTTNIRALEIPEDTSSVAADTDGTAWSPLLEPGVGGHMTGLIVSPRASSRVLVSGDMFGIAYSNDAGGSWNAASGLPTYEMGNFTWHPSRPQEVWCGSMGGPLKSSDGGQSWTLKRGGMPATDTGKYTAPCDWIVFHPSIPSTMWVFGGSMRRWETDTTKALNLGVVWKSTDGGETWAIQATLSAGACVTSAVRLANGTMLAVLASSKGVFKSTDNGQTWAASNTGLSTNVVHQVIGDVSDPATAYVTQRTGTTTPANGVYKSTDSGANWSLLGTGLASSAGADANNTSRYEPIVQSPDGDLFTVDMDFSGGSMYRLASGDTTWGALTDPTVAYPADTSPFVLAADPADSNVLYGGTSDTIIKTVDGGTTWTDASSQRIGSGYRGRGFSGLLGMSVAMNPYVPHRVILGAWDAGALIRTIDEIIWTWPDRTWDAYDGAQHYSWATKDIVYGIRGQNAVFNGVGVSTDAGASWDWVVGSPLMARDAQDSTPGDYCVRPISADGTKCLAVLPNGTVYQTTDTGATWSTLSSYTTGTARWVAAAPDFSSLYILDSQGVKVSTDLGVSWSLMTGSKVLGKLYVDPYDFDVLYGVGYGWRTTGGNWGLWRYENGSWGALSTSKYAADVAIDPGDPNHLILVHNDLPFHDANLSPGVMRSTDRGATWTTLNAGLPILRVATVRFDPFNSSRVVCGTYGRGFHQLQFPARSGAANTDTGAVGVVGGGGTPSGSGDVTMVIWDGTGTQPARPDVPYVIWSAPASLVTVDERDIVIDTSG